MSSQDLDQDDWYKAHLHDPDSFRAWSWRLYDGMRRQRDLHRARAVQLNPRATGGKRKCPYCAGRAFRGPVVSTGENGEKRLEYACTRCGNLYWEEVKIHSGAYKRTEKEKVGTRIVRYIREERKEAEGCRAREVAEALGISPNAMAAWLSLLYLKGKIERVEPGLYK